MSRKRRLISVPPISMDGPTFHGEVISVRSPRKDTLSVDVRQNSENGSSYIVQLGSEAEEHDDEYGRYLAESALTDLCPDDARSLAALLWNAADVAQGRKTGAGLLGVRTLPTIRLCGTEYFIDEQLRQLRNVANPEQSFSLGDPKK